MNVTAIPPIRTDDDYRASLVRVREIFHAPDNSLEADELEILTILVHDYEQRNYSFGSSDPVEAVRFAMDRLNLRPRDLVPYLGASSRVSEILGRRRSLTVEMIQKLHEGLGIPLESLIGTSS
jgi:HTH-type transcriptional regulator / antitoxin HigA